MPDSPFDAAFARVKELAATFKAGEARYLSPDYQEAEARKDFIDKFWTVLGWDVNHDVQTNPYEQEVKVERTVNAGGQRRADYAFYLAPNFRDPHFFVEAKKPAVEIGTKESYFQLIRYGWNSRTSLAVITDFEQFHILDCRCKPDIATALSRAVAKYRYPDYTDREKFAKIYWIFSREAVAGGSIEKRAAELREPRGKGSRPGLYPGGHQSIDESFLKELDEYRIQLAHAFKAGNPRLDSATLTEITQRALDRLVFLRFLEDKGIELRRHVERFGEKNPAWEDFIAASRRLDGIYNGVVFKEHAILDAPTFRVDDAAFAAVCRSLGHADSPYDFNAIPIHILGSIYERFLGKVIVATDKRVCIEDKPEVRKAGGVYYTPEYIVRYIVENTVGKLIADQPPEKIAGMRFADIACGSGSFLLGMYDLLLVRHGNYYNALDAKERKRCVKRGDGVERDGKLYLSLRKKREILLNNIYGVDLDAQAVEVCQLSLYLKLLKDETPASAHQYLLDFEHTAQMKKLLPDLSRNIVCGNSLIGTDILEGQLFADDEERKLNPMNFEDAFPEVMKRGGFDAIVGNPPYLFITEIDETDKKYFGARYLTCAYRFDIYGLFIEKSVNQLLKETGYLSLIIPHTLLSNDSFEKLRILMLSTTFLERVIDIGPGVFSGAKNETMIFISRKGGIQKGEKTHVVCSTASDFPTPSKEFLVEQEKWLKNPNSTWLVKVSQAESNVVYKIEQANSRLGKLCTINQGLRTGDNEKYLSSTSRSNKWRPAVGGKEVGRYEALPTGLYVYYEPSVLDAPRRREIFESHEKIVVQEIRNITLPRRLVATFDNRRYFCLQSTNVINLREGVKCPSILFLLGVLNSTAANFFFRQRFPGNNHIPSNQLAQIPIAIPDKERHDQIVRLVEAMLEAKKESEKAKTDKDKTYYENKCASLDRQIDRLVYDLYSLTDEEIKIVEQSC